MSTDLLGSHLHCLGLEFFILFDVSLFQWWSYEDIIIHNTSIQIRPFKQVAQDWKDPWENLILTCFIYNKVSPPERQYLH